MHYTIKQFYVELTANEGRASRISNRSLTVLNYSSDGSGFPARGSPRTSRKASRRETRPAS